MHWPFHLHEDLAGRAASAEHDGQTRHAFAADKGNLGLAARASRNRYHRGNAAIEEMNCLYLPVGRLEPLPKFEIDRH